MTRDPKNQEEFKNNALERKLKHEGYGTQEQDDSS